MVEIGGVDCPPWRVGIRVGLRIYFGMTRSSRSQFWKQVCALSSRLRFSGSRAGGRDYGDVSGFSESLG